MKQQVLFWLGCWSAFALLFLPFPFVFLPKAGVYLSQLIFPLNDFICSWIGVDISKSYLVSDSLAFYSTSFILFLISGTITFIFTWKWRDFLSKMQNGMFSVLIVILSYFLIRYGLDKLFGLQFYTPASNTIHTPLGQLDKDILFWTSMGTSAFYNQFMAISEIMAGVLILFNQTRFIGLMVGFGILLNVFAINIGFDITVKYLSGLLLFTTAICLCFYKSSLAVFIGKKQVEVFIVSQKWIVLLFIPFMIDLTVTYWNLQMKDSGKSYTVESVSAKSQVMDLTKIARIHFHPEGHLVLENKHQQFTSYVVKNKGTVLIIDQEPIFITIHGNQLLWKERELELVWNIKPIDLKNIPLKQDKTHWYFEKIDW